MCYSFVSVLKWSIKALYICIVVSESFIPVFDCIVLNKMLEFCHKLCIYHCLLGMNSCTCGQFGYGLVCGITSFSQSHMFSPLLFKNFLIEKLSYHFNILHLQTLAIYHKGKEIFFGVFSANKSPFIHYFHFFTPLLFLFVPLSFCV